MAGLPGAPAVITGSRAIELLPTTPTTAHKIVDALRSSAGIVVPVGYVTDGASIPRACWRVIGHPFEGLFIRPALVHDVRCEWHVGRWEDTHREFYHNLLAEGVGRTRAWLMFQAVWHFGPRWPVADAITITRAQEIAEAPVGPNGQPWGAYAPAV